MQLLFHFYHIILQESEMKNRNQAKRETRVHSIKQIQHLPLKVWHKPAQNLHELFQWYQYGCAKISSLQHVGTEHEPLAQSVTFPERVQVKV